jgi:hypothetical protein
MSTGQEKYGQKNAAYCIKEGGRKINGASHYL